MTDPNPADVLADKLRSFGIALDVYCSDKQIMVGGEWITSLELFAAAAALRQQAQPTPDAMREQGQAEGFAAAVQQLRDMSAQKPNPALAVPAAHLADILEQSRIPRAALEQS